jgi:hypothetical protein
MNKLSINININSKGQAEIDTIELENSEGAEIIDFKEEEEEYEEDEEDEEGHLWDGEAYLLAAGSFLHSWPDSWSGETLAKNLLMDGSEPDIEEQMKIKVWYPLMEYCVREEMNPFLFAEQQISALADDLIRYKKS